MPYQSGLRSRLFLGSVLAFHCSLVHGQATAANACDCGYAINDPSSEHYAVFTEALETDFLHLSNFTDNQCWLPQTYNVSAKQSRGPYGKMATPFNVRLNPLNGSSDRPDAGDVGEEASGLQLWVGSEPLDNMISMAEIASRDESMLYGSFGIRMKVTGIAGTCTGFFWYRNNTEEIDMELLSSSFNDTSKPIYLVMQTPTAAEDGYNAAGTSTFHIQQLPFAPSDDFHEYRFDWTKDGVIFYADGNPIISMTWTYPKEPGHLAINHWSNGNAMWSKGPPKDAAVTTIEWVKAYYNSTNQDKLARYATRCSTSEMSQICAIPGAAPSPTPGIFYRNGTMCGEGTVDNKSSDTVQKVTDHDSKTSTATSSKTIPLSRALDSGFFWLLLVLTAMLITRH